MWIRIRNIFPDRGNVGSHSVMSNFQAQNSFLLMRRSGHMINYKGLCMMMIRLAICVQGSSQMQQGCGGGVLCGTEELHHSGGAGAARTLCRQQVRP